MRLTFTSPFTLPFTKMQGAGNDVVVLNAMQGLPPMDAAHFRHLGDRRYGVGCDQILIVAPPVALENDFSYRIVNQDGTEVEHCGNGARCFMRYVRDAGLTTKRSVRVEIARGVIELTELADGSVEVNMGAPRFDAPSLPFLVTNLARTPQLAGAALYQLPVNMGSGTSSNTENVALVAVSVGNPHAVLCVADVDAAPVTTLGAAIENHPAFPNRVNVPFVQVIDRHHIKLRVWERGVGETLACGTGACAAVVATMVRGLIDSPVRVQARGGELSVAWAGLEGDALVVDALTDKTADMIMRGPAVTVYTGSITFPDSLA